MTEELMAKAMFVLYAVVVLGGGLMAVFSRSLVRALVGLILTLFGVSGMYMLMAAPFMAMMQVLIYVGAVVVLIFFAIMLTKAKTAGEEGGARSKVGILLAVLGMLAPVGIMTYLCLQMPYAFAPGVQPTEVEIKALGEMLINEYVLAFELISVVLFVAMAGAILLGFERRRGQ
ncbi:MAG: NADH-quinone oxidoreductase subunit J [Desulfovibrio sp.]|nr:MAG: NADH-quinone oxidoreductase subunit J [Desulfovibrio sp.]